jgi:hypothetical protein
MYKVQINHYDGYVVTVHTFSTIEAAMECHKEFALANQVMEDALTRRIQTGDVKEYNELYEKFIDRFGIAWSEVSTSPDPQVVKSEEFLTEWQFDNWGVDDAL